MADVQVDWHGEEAKALLRSKVVAALHTASILVVNRAKVLLSVAGSGRTYNRNAATGRYSGGYTQGAVTHSAPGEPPYKQTGRLRGSVTYEVDSATLTARAGTNVKYGRALELGSTRGLAPRPWLRRALAECQGQINSIFQNIKL